MRRISQEHQSCNVTPSVIASDATDQAGDSGLDSDIA